MKNRKWAIVSVYIPPNSSNIYSFFNDFHFFQTKILSIFNSIIVIGDFSMGFKNKQEMLLILTIAVREIIYGCIRNLN